MNNRVNDAPLQKLRDEMQKRSLLDARKTASKDNVFSVFEVIDKEVPYCRVLVYLINEYWPSFEKNVLGGSCKGEKLRNIERERFCGAPCDAYDKEGRIDILLETERHVVAIEVKVGAGEQADQLIRYSKTLNKDYPSKVKHIYFLTVDGHRPQTDKCAQKCVEKCETKSVSISFNKHICGWLEDVTAGEIPNPLATHFLEVLNVKRNSAEQTKRLLDVLRQSKEYPKIVQLLSGVMPDLWEEIRTTFLKELTAELCSNQYGFRQTEINRPYKNEIWAERLRKGNKELCLCYQTNFFIRTGEQNEQWSYISKTAFSGSRDDTTSYCTKKEGEAFNLKAFADSNEVLIEWFYDRECHPSAIQCIAESANRFFKENN